MDLDISTTAEDAGILIPSDEIKTVIDRTADWVARQGDKFEEKIKEKQKNQPQFAFLRPGNPYFAYYQHKVKEIRKNEVIAVVGDRESIQATAELKLHVKKAFLGELVDKDEPTKEESKPKNEPVREQIKPPPKEVWVLEKPNLSALQDDIIKLTAQFTARNGRAFQNGVWDRENKNPQFGFLQPFHPLHAYFKKLVADYNRCLLPDKATTEELEMLAKDKPAVIDRVMHKVKWERVQKKSEEEKRKEEEAERNAMALIDWHEFVVVQTIEWDDEEEEVEEEAPQKPAQPVVTALPETKPAAIVKESEGDVDMDVDMDVDEDQEEEPEPAPAQQPVKLRTDYQPRSRPGISTDLKFVTPSGQQVGITDVPEHMKIELSNPRALEQRKQMAQNERESNLAQGLDISANLQRLAERRTDIFGNKEVDIGSRVGEDKDDASRKKEKEKASWDGHTGSIQHIAMEGGMSVRQQIKAIHESKGLTGDTPEPAIGPKVPGQSVSRQPAPPQGMPPQPPPPPTPRFPQPPPSMYPPAPMMYSTGMMPPQPMPLHVPPGFMGAPAMPPRMTGGIPPGGAKVVGERPPAEGEPPQKKKKEVVDEITKILIPERDFLEAHSGPVQVEVKVPSVKEKSPWPLHGQTLRIQVLISDQVKVLKTKIGEQLASMPANKQKLHSEGLGFLKDTKTLAFYNATDGFTVELGMKERGGRKK